LGRALRLNPSDPYSYSIYVALAEAHFFAGRYDEAASWARKAVQEKPDFIRAASVAAACYALAGWVEEANRAIAQVRQLDPTLCMDNLETLFPIRGNRRREDFAKMAEGLRLAGLPE
jgi:Flp pilus assembly protein TadD